MSLSFSPSNIDSMARYSIDVIKTTRKQIRISSIRNIKVKTIPCLIEPISKAGPEMLRVMVIR
jgi:hypothetical protein